MAMRPEQIGKTIEGILKGLGQGKKESKRLIYDTIIEHLDAQEKQHIQPYNYSNGVVTLYIDSPNWMYVFNLKKKKFLKVLQEKAGEEIISEIRLRIGALR